MTTCDKITFFLILFLAQLFPAERRRRRRHQRLTSVLPGGGHRHRPTVPFPESSSPSHSPSPSPSPRPCFCQFKCASLKMVLFFAKDAEDEPVRCRPLSTYNRQSHATHRGVSALHIANVVEEEQKMSSAEDRKKCLERRKNTKRPIIQQKKHFFPSLLSVRFVFYIKRGTGQESWLPACWLVH